MPIYEFYCSTCNVIFNFYSSRINTVKQPDCPRCGKKQLSRRISSFATIGKAREDSGDMFAGLDEAKMERAFGALMREAENVGEHDSRQMAALMRKFSSETGLNLGGSMEEALSRMEAGEDPEQIEKEMGDLLNEDTISLESLKKGTVRVSRTPLHDDTLYEL